MTGSVRDLFLPARDAVVPGRDLTDVISRGRRRKLSRRLQMGLLILLLVVGTGSIDRALQIDNDSPPAADLRYANRQLTGSGTDVSPGAAWDPAPGTDTCEDFAGEPGSTRSHTVGSDTLIETTYTSEMLEVGAGTWKGYPWQLCGQTARVRESDPDRDDSSERDSIIVALIFNGHGDATGVSTGPDTLTRTGFGRYNANVSEEGPDRPVSIYWGSVPLEASEVRISAPGVEARSAEVFDAPNGLPVEPDFYIGFMPPALDVEITFLAPSGEAIQQKIMESLPTLSVTKSGPGDGTIVGTADRGERERVWIRCGTDCWASALGRIGGPPATMILVADEQQGSRFVEWRGPCQVDDQGRCHVKLAEDVTVEAIFE